jgi:hypothetical protein
MGGPGRHLFSPDYGFIQVAATPVSESWPDGDGSEAKEVTFVANLIIIQRWFFSLSLFILRYSLQYTFMLPLEVVGPGGSLSKSMVATPY